MEVNFDGLRKRLIVDYNSLVKKLNRANKDGEIRIEPFDIDLELDGLRSALVTLAFIYQNGEDGFNQLDDNTHFEDFNPEDDE
jgi:hypothetical protein